MPQLELNEMSTKPTTTIRIDPEVKRLAGKVFDDIGLSMSAAINTFLKAVAREGTMPFDIKTAAPRAHVTRGNATLNRAFLVKKDEFYTQYEDVAREMVKHRESLKGKLSEAYQRSERHQRQPYAERHHFAIRQDDLEESRGRGRERIRSINSSGSGF